MKSLTDHLANYAAYHRDPRNIATHLVGVPIIVVALEALLSRPALPLAGLPLTPAIVLSALVAAFYLRLDLRFGLAMTAFYALAWLAGHALAALPTPLWLACGIGLFVVGWIIQFVGHHYEGRKPAFLDDIAGLIIGPLFIVAEAAFWLGLRPMLRDDVEAIAGPTRRRTPAAA
ncbi:DUF962 domain-containing protein [Sphingobium algorifonticola]|uniref:DUF962 domain-containing protein n=1 Tax=Sphingobium algorifonticola TaxID=2008318 RepID=A0A437J8T9_9SPHN|nr:Mpo1-like protein [Sphingobium algorifonticola]RVT41790.1 DUF962 domain-containing protein [Sphingobium algorifonticola]